MNKLIQFLAFCYHPEDSYNTLGYEHALTIVDKLSVTHLQNSVVLMQALKKFSSLLPSIQKALVEGL